MTPTTWPLYDQVASAHSCLARLASSGSRGCWRPRTASVEALTKQQKIDTSPVTLSRAKGLKNNSRFTQNDIPRGYIVKCTNVMHFGLISVMEKTGKDGLLTRSTQEFEEGVSMATRSKPAGRSSTAVVVLVQESDCPYARPDHLSNSVCS